MAPIIPYVKQTWVDGNASFPTSAARMGVLEEGILDASQSPAVRVFHNTTQSINTATITALAFNSERFDQAAGATAAHHDNTTNNSRLTCLYAGVYQITAMAAWASNPSTGLIYIRLNNTTDIAESAAVANYSNMNVTCLYALAVNDYVECRVQQTSGLAVNILSTGNVSPEFMMCRVG